MLTICISPTCFNNDKSVALLCVALGYNALLLSLLLFKTEDKDFFNLFIYFIFIYSYAQ